MIKSIACLSLLALIALPAGDLAAAPRVAKLTAGPASYDGTWNLNIMTERGSCDRSTTVQVSVNNGYVLYNGPARSSGRVAPSGARGRCKARSRC